MAPFLSWSPSGCALIHVICLPANLYADGASEATIGKALRVYNIPRQEVVILTKCWGYVGKESWMPKFKEVSRDEKNQTPFFLSLGHNYLGSVTH